MIMEPRLTGWVEELLKNNHSPSDEAVQEVRRFLVKPLKYLEDLDAEIPDLKNRLSELENRRDETQKRISQYRSILAPIRRIPPDVLGEIFLRCLPTSRNPIMKSTECPLLLTRVCSPWRAIAMSSPRLWERIYITFTDEDTIPDLESAAEMVQTGLLASTGWQSAPSKAAKRHTTDLLHRKYEAVKEWLLRSGTRPLSISLSFPSTFWYNVPYSERPHSVTMEFLSFLATLAPRVRALELKTSSEIYEFLEPMVTVSEMTALASLRIEYSIHFPARREPVRGPLLFHAPHLQNLSIASGDSRMWDIDPSIRWNQLTNISCFDALTITQTIDLLQCSSNLVHYKGIISDYTDGDIPFLYDGYISLPFLRSLSLSQYGNPRRLGNMYDRIDAPSLQLVNYTSEFYTPPAKLFPDAHATPGVVVPILPLLQKSSELQKLSIDVDQFIAEHFPILFDTVPTVTHLVIGSPDRHGSRRELPLFPSTDYDISGFPARDSWGFGNLIVHEHSRDDKPPLLPRLISLGILSPKVSINDDTLIDLIKSRMTPGRTAAMEQVKVICYREREKDVEGELASYAKLVGSKISLDLSYAQPPPSETNPISPEFGLNEFAAKGRSWRYIDAGEDL